VLALRAGIVGNNNPLIQLPTVLPGTDLYEKYRSALIREVDTYFSLGLEFHEGRRLPHDEDLINSSAQMFSSFYNLPCPAVLLTELNLIATYFPLMVRFYPKTFLLLSLEYRRSVSELFIEWMEWLKDRLERKQPELSPQDCYGHFRDFVAEMGQGKGEPSIGHLLEMLRYEDCAIEVGKSPVEDRPFHIDLSGLREFRPVMNTKTALREFDFDLPVIILDLKRGVFKGEYPEKKTWLVFGQEGDILNVVEVNAFARDFLDLCNGDSTLQAISKQLRGRYGKDMGSNDFFNACLEAAQALGAEGLLQSSHPDNTLERR
jgi:hypothetical protein